MYTEYAVANSDESISYERIVVFDGMWPTAKDARIRNFNLYIMSFDFERVDIN